MKDKLLYGLLAFVLPIALAVVIMRWLAPPGFLWVVVCGALAAALQAVGRAAMQRLTGRQWP